MRNKYIFIIIIVIIVIIILKSAAMADQAPGTPHLARKVHAHEHACNFYAYFFKALSLVNSLSWPYVRQGPPVWIDLC